MSDEKNNLNSDFSEFKNKLLSLINRAFVEKHAPDLILKMIEDNKVSIDDIIKSYQFYNKIFYTIDINFIANIKYGCKLLCDMYDVGEYTKYTEFLEHLKINHKI
jgi:hypothetical protein